MARLAAAALAGGVVGLNRELRQKPAGLRTHALVSLGAAAAMLATIGVAPPGSPAVVDAVSRTIQGIMVGIGFLGGGVIVKENHSGVVHNLTTAASIWIAAALGIAAGVGQWVVVAAVALAALLTLTFGWSLERAARRAFGVKNVHDDPDEHTGA